MIGPILATWVERCANKEAIEIILTVDGPDEGSKAVAADLATKMPMLRWFEQPEGPFNCVKGWNLAASKATGKVFVQVTDDMMPPQHWDEELLKLKPEGWIDGEFAVHVEDGYVHDLMVLAIITRKRYERFGYFFYPDYESMFCDTELTTVAYRDKVVINAKHLLFEHMHPDAQKRKRDKVDLVHASKERWVRGETLFNHRRERNFPIDVGPQADKTAKPVGYKFCVYTQATRDDFCLLEVGKRMMEEGVNDFFFSIPDEYWAGRPTPEENMSQVEQVAQQLRQLGANVRTMRHPVRKYRWPGDSRITVETRVRNDALAEIRRAGFEHVLIVDGDELWKRGTLNYVRKVLDEWHPLSINCLMIPVVGLPGYPIDGATDVAVIYLNSKVPFKECRTPHGDQFRLQMPQVVHFTGTRKTMEETIQKHLDSGHYDDPEYDFDYWIKNVLPNIKPGYRHTFPDGQVGIHMFKRYQIWPSVRHWMPEEVTQLPQALHPYLGIEQPATP